MAKDLFGNDIPEIKKKPQPAEQKVEAHKVSPHALTKPSEFKQHTQEFNSAKKSKVVITSPMVITKDATQAIEKYVNSFESEPDIPEPKAEEKPPAKAEPFIKDMLGGDKK